MKRLGVWQQQADLFVQCSQQDLDDCVAIRAEWRRRGGQLCNSSEVPSRFSSSSSSPAPVFTSAPNNWPRVRTSTSGASTSTFSAPPRAPNNFAGRRPSCSVLAMRSVTRRRAHCALKGARRLGGQREVRETCAGKRGKKVVEERVGQRVGEQREGRRGV